MRVGIIGGKEINQTRYEEVAEAADSEVEFHDGKMAGRGSDALETLVGRCDLVVIVIQINSHAAVRTAQKYCRKLGRRVVIVRRFGLQSFSLLLQNEALSEAS
jgi:hypothetical protein